MDKYVDRYLKNIKYFPDDLPLQFFGFFCTGVDTFDDSGTHAAFFQSFTALDGRSAGRGDHIFQLAGVDTFFQDHLGGAKAVWAARR